MKKYLILIFFLLCAAVGYSQPYFTSYSYGNAFQRGSFYTALTMPLQDTTMLTDSLRAGAIVMRSDHNVYVWNGTNWYPLASVQSARIPAVDSVTSTDTAKIDAGVFDMYKVTQLAQKINFAAPTGTLYDGQNLTIRITSNSSAWLISWNAIFNASTSLPLPTTTTANKTLYCQLIYNINTNKWDLVGVLDGL